MCTFWWHFCEKIFLWHFSVLRPQNSDSTLKTNSRMTFWSFCHKAQTTCMQNDFIFGSKWECALFGDIFAKKIFCDIFPGWDLQIRILRWKLILGWHFGQFATKRRWFACKTTSFWVKMGKCAFRWNFRHNPPKSNPINLKLGQSILPIPQTPYIKFQPNWKQKKICEKKFALVTLRIYILAGAWVGRFWAYTTSNRSSYCAIGFYTKSWPLWHLIHYTIGRIGISTPSSRYTRRGSTKNWNFYLEELDQNWYRQSISRARFTIYSNLCKARPTDGLKPPQLTPSKGRELRRESWIKRKIWRLYARFFNFRNIITFLNLNQFRSFLDMLLCGKCYTSSPKFSSIHPQIMEIQNRELAYLKTCWFYARCNGAILHHFSLIHVPWVGLLTHLK